MNLCQIINILSLSTKKYITQNTKLSYTLCHTINNEYVIIFNNDEFIKVKLNDNCNIQKKYMTYHENLIK